MDKKKMQAERDKLVAETQKKMKEKNKKIKEKDKKLKEMNRKLEIMNKTLEERDQQRVEIYKDPVSYIVSVEGFKGVAYIEECLGQYYPTGKSVNGFPIYRNGNVYLYVATEGKWIIGPKVSLDSSEAIISHSDNNPTPSNPPHNGWWLNMDARLDKTDVEAGPDEADFQLPANFTKAWLPHKKLTVLPSSFITYRVSSSNEDLPSELNRLPVLGDYHPTGEFENGFPVFNKGAYVLHVRSEGNWLINDSGVEVEGVGKWKEDDGGRYVKVGEGTKTVNVPILAYHPEKNPTPPTPPPVGWKLSESSKSSLNIRVNPVIGTYQ